MRREQERDAGDEREREDNERRPVLPLAIATSWLYQDLRVETTGDGIRRMAGIE